MTSCLVLALLLTLVQATPQRLERATEIRWCVDGTSGSQQARLVRRSGLRVDGREVGDWTEERVLQVDARSGPETNFLLGY